jgi:anaerobic selenocysteine-containing dehydrogenase
VTAATSLEAAARTFVVKELARTTCNRDCPDACAIVATVEDGKITRLQGDPDHPVTKGFLCYRTSHYLPVQYSPERLTSPMRRQDDGSFVAASWDEALADIAGRLAAIKSESGPAAIFHYRSGGSLGLVEHLTDYFFEKLGPCTGKRGDICGGAGDAAQSLDFGDSDSNDLHELVHAKSIILWGKNVHVSSPHTLPVLKQAKANGAHVTLIDPVHHQGASLADEVIAPRPAGDFALAMAVAHLLFQHDWVDPDAASYCDHLDDFKALATSKSVSAWCKDADVTPKQALGLAVRLGLGKPCAILVGWGMGRRKAGGAIVRALDALGAISGNLGIAGGGVSFYYKRRGGLDTSFIGKTPFPRTVCEPLFGKDVLAAQDPPIRALWVTAGNPAAMLPDSQTVARAIASRELVVVVDAFMTDTARLAHWVLPTTTFLEEEDLVGAYGHHYLGSVRPLVPPPPGVKSDLEIAQALAERLGFGEALAGSAREWKERILAPRLGPHGIDVAALEARPVKNPLAKPVLFADRKFATASGKVNLLTEPPPAQATAGARSDYPFWLMSLSTADAQSSQWSRVLSGPATVSVHPEATTLAGWPTTPTCAATWRWCPRAATCGTGAAPTPWCAPRPPTSARAARSTTSGSA